MSNFPLKQLLCKKTTLNNFELEPPGTSYEVVPPEAVLLCSWFPTTYVPVSDLLFVYFLVVCI